MLKRRGYTLIEALAVMVIGLVVVLMVSRQALAVQKEERAQRLANDLLQLADTIRASYRHQYNGYASLSSSSISGMVPIGLQRGAATPPMTERGMVTVENSRNSAPPYPDENETFVLEFLIPTDLCQPLLRAMLPHTPWLVDESNRVIVKSRTTPTNSYPAIITTACSVANRNRPYGFVFE